MKFAESVRAFWKSRGAALHWGFVYGLLSTGLFFVLFMLYTRDSAIRAYMTPSAWLFYVAAAIPHAALAALALYLVFYCPLACAAKTRGAAKWVLTAVTAVCALAIHINSYVYGLYRFHIDGFILSSLFSADASEAFGFDTEIYLQTAAAFLICAGLSVGLRFAADKIPPPSEGHAGFGWRKKALTAAVIFALALGTQTAHIVSAATMGNTVILKCAKVLPHYYPLTINRFLGQLGLIEPDGWPKEGSKNVARENIAYPKHPLNAVRPDKPLNVLVIAIDSWNIRAFDDEVTPNLRRFAAHSDFFASHLSSSNRTRGSLYGLFFSLSGYYWQEFEYSGIRPVLIEQFLKEGYGLHFYPSATLLNPPIAQALFADVPGFRASTPGANSYERDVQITKDFLSELDGLVSDAASGKPFYAFLFYDLPHTATMPADKAVHFKPSWTFPDYTKLNNDLDPTPFFNLYKNALFEADALVGQVLDAVEKKGLLENTVVMIHGDHGQEFNETKKNYWGHGSNYAWTQVRTPFLYRAPGQTEGRVFHHRTTHYDVVPTLMTKVLGVTNPPSDYSVGHLLWDTDPRDWHVVGENAKRAFILRDGTILRRLPTGGLEILDENLNERKDYPLDRKALNQAVLKLNEFYRKD